MGGQVVELDWVCVKCPTRYVHKGRGDDVYIQGGREWFTAPPCLEPPEPVNPNLSSGPLSQDNDSTNSVKGDIFL
jgi:hypothetical protein